MGYLNTISEVVGEVPCSRYGSALKDGHKYGTEPDEDDGNKGGPHRVAERPGWEDAKITGDDGGLY